MLQLAADLGFLDEPADQVGLVAVRLEQDLDGQVAAEVGIAALEHRSHAAAGDLAEQLQPPRAIRRDGHLGRAGLDQGIRPACRVGITERDVWRGANRFVELVQNAIACLRARPEGFGQATVEVIVVVSTVT